MTQTTNSTKNTKPLDNLHNTTRKPHQQMQPEYSPGIGHIGFVFAALSPVSRSPALLLSCYTTTRNVVWPSFQQRLARTLTASGDECTFRRDSALSWWPKGLNGRDLCICADCGRKDDVILFVEKSILFWGLSKTTWCIFLDRFQPLIPPP